MNDHSHQDNIIPLPPTPSTFDISLTLLDGTESQDHVTAYGTNDGVFHYLLPEGVIRLIPLHLIADIWIVPKYDHRSTEALNSDGPPSCMSLGGPSA